MKDRFTKFIELLKSANWKIDLIIVTVIVIISLGIMKFSTITDTLKYWIKEYSFMQIISGLITVSITIGAMCFIDYQNRKRWLTEAYAREEAKSTIEYKLAFEQLFKGALASIPDCFNSAPEDLGLKIVAIDKLNKRILNYNEKLVYANTYLEKHDLIDTILSLNNGLLGKLKEELYDCNIQGLLTLNAENGFGALVPEEEFNKINTIINIIIDLNKDEIFNNTIITISDFLNSKVLSHY